MKILFFLVTLLTVIAASSAPKTSVADAKSEALRPLRETLEHIQKAKMSEFKIEKKIKSEVMGTEKTYQGNAYLAGTKLRFETAAPEKSLVVFDGKTLWIVQYPDAALGGPIQVLRGKVQGKQKEQLLLTDLLAGGKLLKSFDVKKTADEGGVQTFEATPKDKNIELQKVTLKVKGKDLKVLEYIDDVGNKTSLVVIEQLSSSKLRPELFNYKPEKGAQVSNL